MNLIQQIDAWLFALINNLAGQWLWLDTIARFFLNDYIVPTILAIILAALWFEGSHPETRHLNQRAVLIAALSAAMANIILKLINLCFYRPRPFDFYDVNLLFYQPTDSSMPSNAAALGFSIAAGVWFYQKRWGWGLLGVAAIFGLSRIFGGVHYPFDVISGAILGWSAAWFVVQPKRFIDWLLGLIVMITAKLGLP